MKWAWNIGILHLESKFTSCTIAFYFTPTGLKKMKCSGTTVYACKLVDARHSYSWICFWAVLLQNISNDIVFPSFGFLPPLSCQIYEDMSCLLPLPKDNLGTEPRKTTLSHIELHCTTQHIMLQGTPVWSFHHHWMDRVGSFPAKVPVASDQQS